MAFAGHEFPLDRLRYRLEFLTDRAEAHLASAEDNMLARACAATLLRDAACIALLLDDAGQARGLLHQSGRHFLNLGLPVGAALVGLAGLEDAERELKRFDDVIRGAREQRGPSEARERAGMRRPMTDQARSEPQQLLAMMQADWLASDRGYDIFGGEGDERLRTAARRSGGHAATPA